MIPTPTMMTTATSGRVSIMREFVNGFVSSYTKDDGQEDVIVMILYGPRGGTRVSEVLDLTQARTLRDNLDIALLKINDAHVRAEEQQ
jgi:hypothetical protein